MEDHGRYTLLGRTRDDAAGEAFDKAARILGLGFPGGPEVQRAAVDAEGERSLPRAWLRGTHDFSFSGLKTALLNAARQEGLYPPSDDAPPDERLVREMAYAFQMSVADVMAAKTLEAAHRHGARGSDAGRRGCRQRHAEAGAPGEVHASRVHSVAPAVHGQRRHDRILCLLPGVAR